jgi:hypothetical protein
LNIDILFAQYREALNDKTRADRNYELARQNLQDALQGPSTPETDPNPIVETITVGSRTRIGTRHVLHRFADGNVTCSCEGFRFRKNCGHGGRVIGPTRENGSALSVPA